MQVSDLRPKELMTRQQEAYQADADRLLAFKSEFKICGCPACGQYLPSDLGRVGNYDQCDGCGTLYTNPRPLPAHLAEYYRESQNYSVWAKEIFPASEARRLGIAHERAAKLAGWMTRTGCGSDALLDIGCGFGTFMRAAREQALCRSQSGLEPTPALASRIKDFHVYPMPIEAVTADQPGRLFDVATAFEVIEHLFRPAVLASAARTLLKPGGLLMLTCPNAASLEVMTRGQDSAVFDVEHLTIFTPQGLATLLQAHGFEVLEWSTPGKLDAELLGLPPEYQAAIRKLKVSSHLQVIARRG